MRTERFTGTLFCGNDVVCAGVSGIIRDVGSRFGNSDLRGEMTIPVGLEDETHRLVLDDGRRADILIDSTVPAGGGNVFVVFSVNGKFEK